MEMPLGKQHAQNQGRVGKGSQPSTIQPLWRRGQPPGQVGAVGSQVWPSGPPWLRARRWQLLSRWSHGFIHHPSSHTPHSCGKLRVQTSQKSNRGFKEQQNACRKANLSRKKFYCKYPRCLPISNFLFMKIKVNHLIFLFFVSFASEMHYKRVGGTGEKVCFFYHYCDT